MKLSNKYHKIPSVYKRDMNDGGRFIIGEWSTPEFKYLKDLKWIWTEKIDGTNIRVIWERDEDHPDPVPRLRFAGRSDNAHIPAKLYEALQRLFPYDRMKEVFDFDINSSDQEVVLYGEGYGAKIQKGGGNYRQDNSFVLFDVMIGDIYLERHNVEDIAKKLGIDVVPIVGQGTIQEAIEYTKKGFNSQWGDFIAEGLVIRPEVELRTRRGDRVITKVKYVDFQK